MIWIARIAGVLLIAYGGLAVFFAVLSAGQGFSFPVWNEQAWSADARRSADWAVAVALAFGGFLLLLGRGAARLLFALALAIAAAKTGYDLTLGDPATARQAVLVQGDLIALGVCAVALLVGFVARQRQSFGSADAS